MDASNQIIFLWGMPGSGKTKLGKKTAKYLNWEFIDLDEYIMSQSGESIADIFENEGEDAFRIKETAALSHLIQSNNTNTVIAVGGGTACFYNNNELMNASGTTIYIEVPVEVIISREIDKSNRPLLKENTEAILKALYEKRKAIYETAKVKIPFQSDSWNNLKSFLEKGDFI